jgi:hypothetical protein
LLKKDTNSTDGLKRYFPQAKIIDWEPMFIAPSPANWKWEFWDSYGCTNDKFPGYPCNNKIIVGYDKSNAINEVAYEVSPFIYLKSPLFIETNQFSTQ